MKDQVEFDPDDISKKMFMRELLAARDRLGSTVKVALALGMESRRCQTWVNGVMPLYATMQEVYLKLMHIAKTSDAEVRQIVENIRVKRANGRNGA
jgi:hypothetical protein